MHNSKINFGSRIRGARKARGLSQAEVSRHVGIDQGRLCKIEKGTAEATPMQLKAIANCIGVSIGYIYGEAEASSRTDNLTAEAIELALKWQRLPAGEQEAIRMTVDNLSTTGIATD